MKKIKSINTTKTALSLGILFTILAVINGAMYLAGINLFDVNGIEYIYGFLMGAGIASASTKAPFYIALIIAPIIEGIFYFIIFWIICNVYNLIAKKFPIEVDI